MVTQDLVNDVWEGEYWQKVRSNMLNDIPVRACQGCYDIDNANGLSDRYQFKDKYHDTDVKFSIEHGNQIKFPNAVDIRFSNLCNLKCRMCNTGNSTQLQKEIIDNPLLEQYGTLFVSSKKSLPLSKYNFQTLLNNIDNIDFVKLAGGEPSIMPEVDLFLQAFIDKGRHIGSNAVNIQITTNCTNQNVKFKELISQFKEVNITASFEGIFLVNDYIRFPSHFSTLEQNLISYVKQFECLTNSTIQAYNLPYLKEFTDWIGFINKTYGSFESSFSLILEPDWVCCNRLSKPFRDYYLDMYLNDIDFEVEWLVKSNLKNDLIRLRNDTFEPSNYDLALHTKLFDTARQHHIKDYLPEVYEDIKETYDDIQF